MINNTNLSRALRQSRESMGLTQQEVADMIGISLWSYNRIENGRRTFAPAWLPRLPPDMRRPVIAMYEREYNGLMSLLNRWKTSPYRRRT